MIEIKNASLTYPDGKLALDSVSLNLGENLSCALLGANGAGKSSLLWAIMGLLPLSGGEIFLDKIKVERKNARAIRRIASLVFQNSDDQLFFPTVLEDVAFGLVNSGLEEGAAEIKAAEILERFGILQLKDRQNRQLSDGEKKKVAICASLACSPKILLLDEPSALLDPKSKRECAEIILSLKRTVILSTHDLDFAKKCCRYCLVLKGGKAASFGETEAILKDEKLLFDCGLA